MKNYYSLFNTSETRNSVEAAINSYFSSDIMNQTYTISGFNVICTEVNNTLATIQNNELHVEIQIKLNNSIKFITIITNVVPTL
jgi:predicted 3-demethylubiquinone-9 3-methyltransferase (glyoxalase superfamily)